MRKLGLLAVVIVGLLALLQAASSLSVFTSIAFTPPSIGRNLPALLAAATLPVVAALAIGVFLLVRRRWMSERLFDDESLELPVDSLSLARLAFIVLGVWLVIEAAPWLLAQALSLVAQLLLARADGFALEVSVFNTVPALVARTIEIAIGGVLIARALPFAQRALGIPAAQPPASRTLESCPSCGEPYDPLDYRPEADRRCATCGEPLDGSA